MKFNYTITMPNQAPFVVTGERLDVLKDCGTSIIFASRCDDVAIAIIPREAVIIITEVKEIQS